MTFHILGMSSSHLTNSYFQRGRYTNHQPEIVHEFSISILPMLGWVLEANNFERKNALKRRMRIPGFFE